MDFRGGRNFREACREPKGKELKVIRQALRAYDSLDFLEEHDVLIREGEKKEVYALSKDLSDFIDRFRNLNVVHAGIKVGEVGKRFRFSLEGTFYLARRKRKRVYVNSKGEMLFLYGRDVFAGSVVKVTEDVRENDIVMVCNTKGDIIGIGKSRFDADRMRSVERDRVVVENLVDRGEYLRKERLYNSY
jgi:60S ribosome subunit biogenesis protein NIP7